MRLRSGGFAVSLALAATGIAIARGRVRRYEIAEQSMHPALDAGDYVIAIRSDRIPVRGDIVIAGHPGDPEFDLVKRVVGLPGETVAIANGQVNIDGTPLAEPWAEGPTRPDGVWTLGTDELFLLGDQRAVSAADGRHTGPIGADAARWRVAVRYWPPQKIGTV